MNDGPDLLERTRMALAEVGVDPMLVSESPFDGSDVHLDMGATTDQLRWAWRALMLARWVDAEPGACWSCVSAFWSDRSLPEPQENCRAYLPLTEDCGIDRTPNQKENR